MVGSVEVETDDDVVRIVDGASDAFGDGTCLSANVGEAVERGAPGVVVGDRVLDVECGHAANVGVSVPLAHPRFVGFIVGVWCPGVLRRSDRTDLQP